MKRNIHASEKLRSSRLLARKALVKAGTPEFKLESSAKWVDISRNWKGTVLVQIEHDDIHNCTPEQLLWWFHHLSDTTTWNGVDFSGPSISNYHLWHH